MESASRQRWRRRARTVRDGASVCAESNAWSLSPFTASGLLVLPWLRGDRVRNRFGARAHLVAIDSRTGRTDAIELPSAGSPTAGGSSAPIIPSLSRDEDPPIGAHADGDGACRVAAPRGMMSLVAMLPGVDGAAGAAKR
jgi:hypothetical protein